MATCKTPGCHGEAGLPGTARGLCRRCYNRFRRGEVDAESAMPLDRVKAEVGQQVAFDRERGGVRGVLAVRARAVAEAEDAFRAGEIGGREALRGALVDIAAAAMLGAADLDADAEAFEAAVEPEAMLARV